MCLKANLNKKIKVVVRFWIDRKITMAHLRHNYGTKIFLCALVTKRGQRKQVQIG